MTWCKMGRNRRREFVRHVLPKDAPTMLPMEEYVLNMVPRSSSAATRDAPTMLSREEYVLNMVLRSSSAAKTDVPTNLRKEEYV